VTPPEPQPSRANPFDLTGKVALVTGASGGLGAAIAIALAEAGADVAVHGNSRAPKAAEAAVTAAGRRALSVVGDLRDRGFTDSIVPGVVDALGRFDILINNAGAIRRAPAADYSDEDWDHLIEVNLTSVFRLARAAGRHFLTQPDPASSGSRGKIVNIASLLSFQGGLTVTAYTAAKGGVAQLTKGLSNEWASRGINVNAIAPGYMVTDNTAALRADPVRSRQILERIPAARWGDPADLAGAAIFLSSTASNYVHGHVLVVDGGWLGR
jgi:2-dehydro-3-deoxy-D-gluconate 5-dehydrogenase